MQWEESLSLSENCTTIIVINIDIHTAVIFYMYMNNQWSPVQRQPLGVIKSSCRRCSDPMKQFFQYSTVIIAIAWELPYFCFNSTACDCFLITTVELVITSAGNKSDRTDREVTQQQGRQFAQEKDVPFLEVSAKNSNNIDKLFLQLAKMLLELHIDKKPRSHEGVPNSGTLAPRSHRGLANSGSLAPRSHRGLANSGSLVPRSHEEVANSGSFALVLYAASVRDYSGGGKPPLTVTLEQARGGCRCWLFSVLSLVWLHTLCICLMAVYQFVVFVYA